MKTMQATALRKNLFERLKQIEGDRIPVEIRRHGQSVAVLVPSVTTPPKKRKPLIDLNSIEDFCKKHGVKGFFLFGSILRDDFNENSDVDIMVDTAGKHFGFHETCRMIDDLELMFGRKVDLLTKEVVESRRMNKHRRALILASARMLYGVAA